MTRNEARDLILEGVGFRSATSILPSGGTLGDFIAKKLEKAQREYEKGKTLPNFLLLEDETLTLLEGEHEVDLPEDFLRLHEDERLSYLPEDSNIPYFVVRKSWDDAVSAYGDAEDDGPKVFVLRKDTLYILPAADTEYTLTWSYYAKGNVLSGSADVTDNVWLLNAPYLLVGEAGAEVAEALRDKDAVATFSRQRDTARRSVYADVYDQETAGGPLVIGGENY